jgi:hypothetical protein
MEQTFISSEELTELKELNSKREILQMAFGSLEIEYQTQKAELLSELNVLNEKSTIIGSKLVEKFGDGTINVETGEFVKK